METLSNSRSSIVRIPRPQLERATRHLAWKSFRARLAHYRMRVPTTRMFSAPRHSQLRSSD
jgi:hypothetical protein